MTITNDLITFEDSDFQKLSADMQAAVQFRAGVQNPLLYLSLRFNAVLEESLNLKNKSVLEDPESEELILAFAKIDVSTQDQIKTLLGVS